MGIKDEKKIAYMKKISKSVEEAFSELGFVREDSLPKEEITKTPKKEEKKVEKTSTKKVSSNISAQLAELKDMVAKLTKEVKTIKKILNED